MGRMNGNQTRSVTASAVSQISGSVECEPSGHSSHEWLKRNRRGRRTNLATDDSRKMSTTSREHLSRNNSSRSSDLPNSRRTASNRPSDPEFRSTVPPQGAYAGAKFGDSPSPRLLPPPPLRWISGGMLRTPVFGSCLSLTSELKTLLRVA